MFQAVVIVLEKSSKFDARVHSKIVVMGIKQHLAPSQTKLETVAGVFHLFT